MSGKIKFTENVVYQAVVNGELEIDANGRVWRVARRQGIRGSKEPVTRAVKRKRAESRPKSKDSANGYLQVRFMIRGYRHHACAHRLVWRHFFGPIPADMTVNHKNGIKDDNCPTNLELMTDSEQQLHAVRVLGYNPTLNLGNHARRAGERSTS